MVSGPYLAILGNTDFGMEGVDVLGDYRFTMLQLLSNFSSKFQSPMTIFHQKLLKREGRVLVNG